VAKTATPFCIFKAFCISANPYKMQLAAGFWRLIGQAMRSPKLAWSGLLFLLAGITATVGDSRSSKSQAALPDDANQFVREAIQNELNAEGRDHTHWRYHLHREDERGSQDRDVIETKEGSLAKTLLINGRPLTPEQRDQDEERMKKLVSDPSERAKRDHRLKQDEEKAHQLLQAIPEAFIFKYNGIEGTQVRLEFKPNASFSPPTRELAVYHAMNGKVWIDQSAKRLSRIEGELFERVNFGWGLLGHLEKGGTFRVLQQDVGDGHWNTIQLDVNMQGRAVVFKSLNIKEKENLTDFRRMPDDLSMSQAFGILEKAGNTISANTQATAR
jgi:hypothetical protein